MRVLDSHISSPCSRRSATPRAPPTGPRCGDGVVHLAAGEQCDDGNLRGQDGRSASCQLELP
ncbi:hypothetical protein [Myxococcus sp. AM011]|uniref:hypothetical protein n=1 Tax=Myxococcus sp. AM011 TaxID=2745200 RepID=UPI0020CBB956|nr:hypothetical protein [Myxococcus sp. AM011]